MLWVCWNIYNEAALLPAAVEACDQVTPGCEHVFIDGRYPTFPGDSDLSDDGTREFCQQRGLLVDCPADEVTKRSTGFATVDQLAADGDRVLVLDADEHLTALHPDDLGTAEVGLLTITRDTDSVSFPRPRMFAWQPGLHYVGRHYDVFAADGRKVSGLWAEGAPTVGSLQHHDVRDPQRTRVKGVYYRWLAQHEKAVS